jgi:biofilm PGA synthesis N-glycosyltransferase PgaC
MIGRSGLELAASVVFWVSVGFIFYTYIGYYVVLKILSKVKKAARILDASEKPSVSMLIAAYNEEGMIREKLGNCLSLDYPADRIEFLVGSDGSTDRTAAIVRETNDPRIRLFDFDRREGKLSVINKIVPEVRGDVLVFSDANTMYSPDAVRRMTAHFADPQVGGVCGNLKLINPNENIGGKGETAYWRYENALKALEGSIRTVFGATGGIYAIRRSLFEPLRVVRTSVSDDFLIPLKVVEKGYDIVYEAAAVASETTSVRMRDEFWRKTRVGSADYHSISQIRKLLNPFRGFVAFGLWSHKVIRWMVPFFLILLLVSNALLLDRTLYLVFGVLQGLFYILGGLGWLISRLGGKSGPLAFIYYFIITNSALLVGFFRHVTGTQKPTWTRFER